MLQDKSNDKPIDVRRTLSQSQIWTRECSSQLVKVRVDTITFAILLTEFTP